MKHNLVRFLLIGLIFSSVSFGGRGAGPVDVSAAVPNESPDSVITAPPTTTPDSVGFDEGKFEELEELVVVQRQKLIQNDGATLTYNVSEDPASATSNTLDILRKVPGVSVDAEDNVKVKGQSNFKILLNGREDPMLNGDIKTILKSLPASSIKKIEVISEPGAKYEAEGVGGILNIVTDRSRKLSGFMTQMSAWVNASSAGAYVNARTKLDKVMLDATVSYNDGHMSRPTRSETTTESLVDSPNYMLKTNRKHKGVWEYTGVNLQMSWEPDTLNLVTFSTNFGYNLWDSKVNEGRVQYGRDMSALWELSRISKSRYDGTGFGAQASYQHNFGRDDHNIVASYQFDRGWSDSKTTYLLENLSGQVSEQPYSYETGITRTASHILQLDYANRFGPKHLLEAGAKANLNDDNATSRAYAGDTPEDAIENKAGAVGMKQLKDIYALYASYSGSFSKLNVKAGLRYEHTRMGARYRIGDYPDFTTRLNDLVPNLAVSYSLESAASLRLAYQMRISRPGINVINPYVNTLTPGSISYGNPDLKSERGHIVSFTYSNYGGKFGGSAQLSYRYSDNSLTDILFMKDGIIHSTYANVGMSHLAMLDLSCDWSITPELRWSLYASGSYTYLKADSEMLRQTNAGWQSNVSTDISYSLPHSIRLSGYGGFWTPWIDLQTHGGTTGYFYGLGASKSWLKDDAFTVQLGLSNIFPIHRKNIYTQEDTTLRLTNVYRYQQWHVGLTLSYRFGGLKASVKQTAASIERESSSSSSQNRGGKN